MTTQKIRTLYCTGGDSGGNGKSLCAVLFANWLKSKGIKRAYIDADPGNEGTARAFSHFLEGSPVRRIDIMDEEDLDNIFNLSAASEVDVICDLPANSSSGNMGRWWRNVATPEAFNACNLRLVTIIPVTPLPGAVQNALNYMETVGNNGTYVIALNRFKYAYSPKPVDKVFEEWMSVIPEVNKKYDLRTIEIDHLPDHYRDQWVASQTLPSQIKDVPYLVGSGIRSWANKVNEQLEACLL